MHDPAPVALLRMDQRRRWQEGERLKVEAYLEQEPALKAQSEAVLELIYNEIVLREENGDEPALEEYVARFPEYADQLRIQFEVHRALEGVSLTDGNSLLPEQVNTTRTTTTPTPLTQGATLPGYEILGELGRGGMGIVYRARQVTLKRTVALKMILAGAHAGARERASFRTEAEAVARLQHPNIVQIYDVAEHDGTLYLALEFVDGPSLDKQTAGRPCPAIDAAKLIETIARAVHYVHQQGIVHRDLKPSNILLRIADCGLQIEQPEKQPQSAICNLQSAIPKITDFGVAKLLDSAGSTATGDFLGTPHYMAPEQAGGSKTAGPAADVYSLGAILYELLTGRPPFQGSGALEVLEQARSREPLPPSRVQAGVPADLETICLKCLEKEPARRYASAADLADELGRFLAGEPIKARPAAWWERLWKWAKRRPAAAALAVLAIAALPAVLLLSVWQRQAESGRFLAARAKYDRFMERRDDALFYGIYGTAFADSHVAENLEATRTRVEEALAGGGMNLNVQAPLQPDAYLSERENADITRGCYQLLLVLAEAVAQPAQEQTPADQGRQVRAALEVLQRAGDLLPPTKASYLRRARYQRLLGQEAEAKHSEGEAAHCQPATAIDYFNVGYERYVRGELDQAIRDLGNAQVLQRDDFWSLFFLALCYEKKSRPSADKTFLAEAKSALDKCISQRPRFAWSYLVRAAVHENLNASDEAKKDYETAFSLESNGDGRYYLYTERGRIRLQRGRLEEAAADLHRAIALKPAQFWAHFLLAQVYQRQKRFDESQQELAEALKRRPGAFAAECHLERARNFYLGGQYTAALDACAEAGKALPRPANLLRGKALLKLERFKEAALAFDRYRAAGGPESADFFRARGHARLHLGDHTGALTDFTRVLEREPDAEIYRLRGWAHYFADAWKAALGDFEEAIRRDTRDGDAYVGRGLCRVMLGAYRQATADAETALERRPTRPEMMHNIACIFALAVAKVKAAPEATNHVDLIAGYRAHAIDSLRRALAMVPAAERTAFWRDRILTDKALDSIRDCAEFKELAKHQGTLP